MNFDGRRVLITGGSGAIGRALCVAFAQRGARVAVTYFLNPAGKETTEAAGTEAGGLASAAIKCNVREAAGAEEAAGAAIEALGGVDILIHNAATGVLKPASEISRKSWMGVMEVNARALLGLVQALAPQMGSGGRVLALSSAGADRVLVSSGGLFHNPSWGGSSACAPQVLLEDRAWLACVGLFGIIRDLGPKP